MIAPKMIELLEKHSDRLTRELMTRIQRSKKMADMRKVPAKELEERVAEVYHNLGDWLLEGTESDVERRYTLIGARRARQGVALSHLLWAIIAVKENLIEFLIREAMADEMFELLQELELIQVVDAFFNRALYYAARGHELAAGVRAA